MSRSTKRHIYPYTLRTAAMVNVAHCTDKAILYLAPPAQALTIENLFCHLRFTFNSDTPVGDRVVEYIGVCNEIPILVSQDPSYLRKIDLNVAADGNRKVDIKVDLSELLNRNNANYREYFDSPVTDDFTYCILKLADGNRTDLTVGTIDLWKLDGLFTTTGIR